MHINKERWAWPLWEWLHWSVPCGAVVGLRDGSPWFCPAELSAPGTRSRAGGNQTLPLLVLFIQHCFWHLSFQTWVYPRALTLKIYKFFSTLAAFSCSFQNPPFHSLGQRSSLWYMLSLSVSFPLYFFLIVPSTRPVANPSQPRAHPGAGQESSTTANTQYPIPMPLLLWLSSRDAVRAGEQWKHQPPFSFPLPALRPHSIPAPHGPSSASSIPSSHSGAFSSALLPQGFSMNQQQSPSFQSKYNLFFALNVLWRNYVSPKQSIAEFKIHHGLSHNHPADILGSNFSNSAAKGLSVCVCACLSLLDHIYGEQFENNRRREQTHRAEQREPFEGVSWLKPSPYLQSCWHSAATDGKPTASRLTPSFETALPALEADEQAQGLAGALELH